MYEMLQADCARLGPRDLFGLYFVPLLWGSSINPLIFPFPKTYRWDSLEKVIRHIDAINGIACATPQIWQIEPLVYAIAHSHGLPIAITPPQNLPILGPFCEQANIDLVIVDSEHLPQVHDVLSKTQPKPKAIIVIHHDVSTLPVITEHLYPYIVVHELHIIPGLPLVSQTIESAFDQNDTNVFFKNELFSWHGTDSLLVDLPSEWPIHTANIKLPFHLIEFGTTPGNYTIHV